MHKQLQSYLYYAAVLTILLLQSTSPVYASNNVNEEQNGKNPFNIGAKRSLPLSLIHPQESSPQPVPPAIKKSPVKIAPQRLSIIGGQRQSFSPQSQAKHGQALNKEELSYDTQMKVLHDKLLSACKLLFPSKPSSQHATLLYASHLPIHIEHAIVLKHFFGRDKYGGLDEKKESTGNHSTHALGGVYVKADDYLFDEVTNPLDFMMEKAVSLLSYHLFPQESLIASSTIATFSNLREEHTADYSDQDP